jgi:hypothetical protein
MTIFLSYAHEDLESVKALSHDLEELCDPVWFDNSLSGGQEWWDEILRQIRKCRLFVLAVSRYSLASEACLAEWAYASTVNRPLLTVRLDRAELVGAPASIKRHQYVDYVANDADSIRKLAKAVRFIPSETPLPADLPAEPAMPESYRDRFAELFSRELPIQAQFNASTRLKLDVENDASAAEAITLLRVLRDRIDTSWRVRQDIDSFLAEHDTTNTVPVPPDRDKPQSPQAAPQQPLPIAGWYVDPTRRFELRYWDGSRWSEHVARAGVVSADPLTV